MNGNNNLMLWTESDPRWRNTWWGSYKTYHRMHDKWHERLVSINAWHWARESSIPQKIVKAAMREAWRVAPYRCGIHGIELYKTEWKKYMIEYRKAIKKLNTKAN